MNIGKKIKALIVCLLIIIIPVSVSAATTGTTEDPNKKKEELEDKKNEAEEIIKELETQKGDTAIYIQKLDEQVAEIQTRIDEYNAQIAEVNTQIEQTQAELDAAKADEATQYDTMKERIKFMYENGDTAYIDVLLQADDLSDLLSRSEYVSQISEYDYNMFQKLQDTRIQIANDEALLQSQLANLSDLNAQLAADKTTVDTILASKQEELESLDDSIDENQELVAQYKEDIAQQDEIIQQQIEEARKKAEASGSSSGPLTSTVISTGTFVWPCPGYNYITTRFGDPDVAGITHRGIDIVGASSGSVYGASIVASASGTVVSARFNSSMGNYVVISHGSGVYTTYMHASSLAVSEGQYVQQGTTIAYVGSTGFSTGAHLHFQVTIVPSGQSFSVLTNAVNPLNYFDTSNLYYRN